MLKDSRSYAGTVTHSDHRLVVTRIDFRDVCLCYKHHSKSVQKFNTSELASNPSIQTKYRQTLVSVLSIAVSPSDPNEDLTSLIGSMKDAAAKSIGVLSRRQRNRSDDDEVKDLSHQGYLMRQQLNSNQSTDRSALRSSINHLTNKIQKRLNELRSAAAEAVYSDITNTTDSRRMFEAVRTLNNTPEMGYTMSKGVLLVQMLVKLL